MKKLMLIVCTMFIGLSLNANGEEYYKDYVYHSDGEFFMNVTVNNNGEILGFARTPNNCEVYIPIMVLADRLGKPASDDELRELYYHGTIRIDGGELIDFKWGLELMKGDDDVAIQMTDFSNPWVVRMFEKGANIEIKVYNENNKLIENEKFSLMGFTASAIKSQKECRAYVESQAEDNAYAKKVLREIEIALIEAELPVNEDTIAYIVAKMKSDAEQGIEPNARRAVISLQKELIRRQKMQLNNEFYL